MPTNGVLTKAFGPHKKIKYGQKNYTISSLRYLTSLSDIIPFIQSRRTGEMQLTALIEEHGKRIHFDFENRKVREHLRDQDTEKVK